MSMLLLALAAAAAQPALPALEEVIARACPKLTAAQKRVAVRPLNQMPDAKPLLAVVQPFVQCQTVRSVPAARSLITR